MIGSRESSPFRPGSSFAPVCFKSEEISPIDIGVQPAIHPGRVAVVTGAASGIGRAAAKEFAKLGLRVAIADLDKQALEAVGAELSNIHAHLQPNVLRSLTCSTTTTAAGSSAVSVLMVPADVVRIEDVMRLRDKVYETWGEVAVLINNAGVGTLEGKKGKSWEGADAWRKVFDVNVFGVVNVQQTFIPWMLHQKNSSMIINTGSKRGATNPPGNAAYNASKAAIKSLTESLAHELREHPAQHITAHLFLPGWTHTGLTGAVSGVDKPAVAWSAEEAVLFMIDRVRSGEFYVIVPDNETPRVLDEIRILWAAGDITEGRPALSRWHPAYTSLYENYMREIIAARD